MSIFTSENIVIVVGAFIILERILVLIQWGKKLNDIKKEQENMNRGISGIASLAKKTWELHDVKDEDGVPVWYFRKSIDKLLEQLAESQIATNSLLATLTIHIETQNKLTEKMINKLEDIENTSRESHQKVIDTLNKKLN